MAETLNNRPDPRRKLRALLYLSVFLIVFVVPGAAAFVARALGSREPLLTAVLAEVVGMFVLLLALRRMK